MVATESWEEEVVVSTWFPRNAVARLIIVIIIMMMVVMMMMMIMIVVVMISRFTFAGFTYCRWIIIIIIIGMTQLQIYLTILK